MERHWSRLNVLGCGLVLGLLLAGLTSAQHPPNSPSAGGVVPHLIKFSGVVREADGKPRTGVTGITFALYKEQEGGAALWVETQNVDLDSSGHYTVLLGPSKSEALPVELFLSDEAHWLEAQPEGQAEQPRVPLVNVPSALKAPGTGVPDGRSRSALVLAEAQTDSSLGTGRSKGASVNALGGMWLAAAGIQLISPNGGETWPAGTTQTISWNFTGSVGSTVKIELFKRGVLKTTISSGTSIGSAGTGSFSWVIPNSIPLGTDYTVRVTSTTNSFFTDLSDQNFRIDNTGIVVVQPNGGDTWVAGNTHTIRWIYGGSVGTTVNVQLLKSAVPSTTIVSGTPIGTGGNGSLVWTVPLNQTAGTDYAIQVTSVSNSSVSDQSDRNFSISTTKLPNGGGELNPFLVSGPSPFPAGCAVSTAGDINYHNAEVEPFLAVNPKNPNNLVGVWQQDRWQSGGAAGLLTGVSHDGGKTWARTFAHFTLCSGGTVANGGDYDRASDPWVTFAPDGTAYQIGLSSSSRKRAVLVSESTDGGDTWSEPVALDLLTNSLLTNDKPSITADPTRPGYVYAAWDLIDYTLSSLGDGFFTFSRTTNGGVTWEPFRNVYDPGVDHQVDDNVIVVLPDGTLVDFCGLFDVTGGSVAVFRSTDAGLTWGNPIVINSLQSVGVVDVKTGEKVRTGEFDPSIAVDHTTGTLYVVWQDARFSGNLRDGIVMSKSTDGGLTWSAPVQVNQAPNVQAFTAAADVASDGTVAVTYYDFRQDTSDPTVLLTNYWRITSTDGGITWQEIPLAGPFDMRSAPAVSGGFFVGDYMGLTQAGTSFLPFFAQANSGNLSNPTDIFFFMTQAAGNTVTISGTTTNGHLEVNAQPQGLSERLQSHRKKQPRHRPE